MNAEARPVFPNYQIVEKLGEGLHSTVYKAFHKKNPRRPLALKVLKSSAIKDTQRRHIHHKIERLKVIHHPLVVTPLSFEARQEPQFIVQEHFPGVTLDRWSRAQGAVKLADFFHLACELAQAVGAVHEAGIIHGGLKPHNILVRPDTLDVRIIDFISPLDIREVSHFIYDPGFVEGTLAYTSPEQTGRINHRVDFSTDMYSLAIMFYELLTGRLPFTSRDPLELIHSHLAEEAPSVHAIRPEVPEMVGRIIAKLCLKEPEKRYQSGHGLHADLRRCQQEYEKSGTVGHFPLGLMDHTRRVVFISKMVGREREAQVILDEYEKVTEGEFRSIFISGFPGIGKTRLIQELQRPLVRHKGYFTSGKFDQYQKNIPYSSLIQALRNLIRIFLTESDERVAAWRQKILEAVGRDGRVITDVVPELGILIGPQPEVQALPPVEARNRFNNLFDRFLSALASRENPLILFIDDLQWCDIATFDFLNNLFARGGDHPYLYFIGAYRHNEVDAAHPLARMLRAIKERRQPLQEIQVGPLDAEHCHEMVAYILDSRPEQAASLAAFVAELTEGNPLFVSESLSYLYNENLLSFSDRGEWQWDMERIRESNMPATVVELFGSKIGKLPAETLGIIVYCACMGNRFTAEEVSLIREIRLLDLYERLKPVLSLGLLMENKSDLQFVHDRVQEAVLRTLSAEQRRAIHWIIGNHLLGSVAPGTDLESLDNLFTVAAHLNLGKPAELDRETRYRLADINYHAGNKALDALAVQAANEYFKTSLDLLPEDCWQGHYQRTFKVYQKLAKTELMCGRYERSEQLINQLVENAQSELDKAEALAEQTTSLSSIGNFIEAIKTANRGLAYFGKAIPEDPQAAAARMRQLMEEIHAGHADVWEKILHMPFTGERKGKIELAFYSELIPDLYMSGLVPQLYLSAAQSTCHCLQGGMDESVIYSFSIMGLNLGEQGQFDLAFRYEDLAHDLCALYPNTFGATRGMNGIVWCNMHSRSHPSEIVQYCLRSIQCGKTCGDLYNAGLSYGPLMWNLQVQGADFARIEEYARECLEFSRKNQLSFSVGLAEAVQAGFIEPMKKDYTPTPMEEKLALWRSANHVASAGSYFVHLALCHYYFGLYEQAETYLHEVNRYLTGLTDNVLKRQWYVFQILNALRLHENGLRDGSPEALNDKLRPLLEKVETWASLGPLLKPYLALIHAEKERVLGHFREARGLYMDAINTANRQGYAFLEGYLNECLGELLLGEGHGIARHYIGEAARLYRKCRAERKEILLMERYPGFFEEDIPIQTVHEAEALQPYTLPNLDVDYLMKSSMAIAAEIDLENLLHKIMTVVLECSGAQHGYLLVPEADGLHVRAESHAGEKNVTSTQRCGLSQCTEICSAVIQYVYRTQENILLDDASAEGEFKDLAEVQALKMRSVLCLPVVKQSRPIGVLYLENRLARGVFTPDKTQMTELLTSHAAISLENAHLVAGMKQAEGEIQRMNEDLERRVNERTAELRAANKELESFSYSVSHDLRAPLRIINGFSQILLESYAGVLDAEGQDYLRRVCRSSERMGQLIDDLLKLSRVSRSEMHRQNVDMSAMAAEICTEFQQQQPQRKVEWVVAPRLTVSADPGLLRVALENLVSNAWKFTQKREDARIRVGATEVEGEPVYFVSDNGIGFDNAYADKLFVPFQRLHTTDEFVGTGIGLALVQRVINRHSGRVWADCRPEDGTVFYFML